MAAHKKGTPYDKLAILPYVVAETFLQSKGEAYKLPENAKWCQWVEDFCKQGYTSGDSLFDKVLRGVRCDPRAELCVWLEHWYQSWKVRGSEDFYKRFGVTQGK